MGERGLERKCKFEDRSLLQSRINDKTMKRIRGQASILKYSSIFAVALLLHCSPIGCDGCVAAYPPTFPVEQPIDLFPIRPTLYRLQYRLYIGQAKWSMGQLPKFSAYTGDLQGFLGDLLGGLAGYRPRR